MGCRRVRVRGGRSFMVVSQKEVIRFVQVFRSKQVG